LDIATAAVSFGEMKKVAAKNRITIDPALFTVRDLGKAGPWPSPTIAIK
jgi:hypothetical protein